MFGLDESAATAAIYHKYLKILKKLKEREKRMANVKNKKKELQTLLYLLQGKSVDFMAKKFGLTDQAIKFRLTNLYKTYGVRNRYELMAKFIDVQSVFIAMGQESLLEEDDSIDVPNELKLSNSGNEPIKLEKPLVEDDTVSLKTKKSDNIWS